MTTTNSQDPSFDQEEFDKMVKEGTKIWAGVDISRDASQAASIADDQEFFRLRLCWLAAVNEGNEEDADIAHYAMCELIDAKLAQARDEGRRDSHETNVTMLNLKLKAEDRAATAEAKLAAWDKIVEASLANDYATRAIAAESRLAEIQRGVEGLSIPYEVSAFRVAPRKAVWLDEVLALLQPQGQADTSGLPG